MLIGCRAANGPFGSPVFGLFRASARVSLFLNVRPVERITHLSEGGKNFDLGSKFAEIVAPVGMVDAP